MKLVVTFFVVLFMSTGVLADVRYTVTDLGILNGATSSRASAINNLGQIVGSSGGRTFLYTNGSMLDIIEGPSTVTAINDLGQIVGYRNDLAFVYQEGSIQNLGTLGGNFSRALDINNSGQIVGTSSINESEERYPFLYSNGSMQNLGSFNNPVGSFKNGSANGINNLGQITGFSTGESAHAFLYSDGVLVDIETEAETYPLLGSLGTGINDSGQIAVQRFDFYPTSQSFLYSNNSFTHLGAFGGLNSGTMCSRINNLGHVVGLSYTEENHNGHAFIFIDGTMNDLNLMVDDSLGWTLQYASDINDLGQIVGFGTNSFGQPRAFLLNPIPSPSVTTLLGISFLTHLGRRRK